MAKQGLQLRSRFIKDYNSDLEMIRPDVSKMSKEDVEKLIDSYEQLRSTYQESKRQKESEHIMLETAQHNKELGQALLQFQDFATAQTTAQAVAAGNANAIPAPANNAQPIKLTMNPSQPVFHGNAKDNINDWLTIIQHNMVAAGIPEQNHVTVAIGYLRHGALQAYEARKALITDWDTFKRNMRSAFLPSNYQRILTQKLNTLQYPGSVLEYNANFSYLINQTEDISVAQQIYYYCQHLISYQQIQLRWIRQRLTLYRVCN